MKRPIIALTIALGFLTPLPIQGAASAANCPSLFNEKLTPMSFTLSEWTSNGITKEYVDSSYRSYGRISPEPWIKNSNYLPNNLLEKLSLVPVNEKNVEVWFERSPEESFKDTKRIGWPAFPSEYKPYLEIDTVISADAGDWIRFVASIQIKDCGAPTILYSSPAKYPLGKLSVISIETIKQLKEGVKDVSNAGQITFDKFGPSPWHFVTAESLDRLSGVINSEFNKARDIGEHFLIPSTIGFQNQISLNIRPVSPTDCLGFEFNNLAYTKEGLDIFFSKLPCQVTVIAKLPAKLFSGPPLPISPDSIRNWDCFECSISVTIAKVTVNPKSTKVTKKSITCTKGKVTKKVTAVSPKCPAGYKKK